MRILILLSNLLLIASVNSAIVRDRRSSDRIANGAMCDGKASAFFVVDNSRLDAEAVAVYEEISEEDCLNVCSENKDNRGTPVLCASLTYDPKLFKCTIHGKRSVPDGDLNIESEAGKRYFEKFCIDEDVPAECSNAQFIRVQQSVVIGYAKNVKKVQTLEECVLQCLREQFDCKSAMFFYGEGELGECITNTESALTVPSSFNQEETDKVVYFQNGCSKVQQQQSLAAEVEKELKAEKEQNPVARKMAIDDIVKEDVNDQALEGMQRTPQRVEIKKKSEDADAGDNAKPMSFGEGQRTREGMGRAKPKSEDTEAEDSPAEGRRPQKVEVMSRTIYEATVDKSESEKGNEESVLTEIGEKEASEAEMKENKPVEVKPVPQKPGDQKKANVDHVLGDKEQREKLKGIMKPIKSSKVAEKTTDDKDANMPKNKPKPLATIQVAPSKVTGADGGENTEQISGMTNKELETAKSALRKYEKLKIETLNDGSQYFSEWGPWTPCVMNGERRIRRRRCMDLRKCIGALMEISTCKIETPQKTRRPPSIAAASVRTIVSPGPTKIEELPGRPLENISGKESGPASSANARLTNKPVAEDPSVWAPWEGICKQFPTPQPCHDHKQIGFESRECLSEQPRQCIGPFFRYCTIAC